MIAGVNGAGKTTSIAKPAEATIGREESAGRGVRHVPGRGGRTAHRVGPGRNRLRNRQARTKRKPLRRGADACEKAKARGFDVLIVDTAGQTLHTQTHLMKELEKIHRIVARQIPSVPHEGVLLVLDATTGQNARVQAEQFSKSVKCTGIILSKLDGTAKGGAIFAIKKKLGLPVKYVGVGEKLDDMGGLRPRRVRYGTLREGINRHATFAAFWFALALFHFG